MCFTFPFFFNAYSMSQNERRAKRLEYNAFVALGWFFVAYWVFSSVHIVYTTLQG